MPLIQVVGGQVRTAGLDRDMFQRVRDSRFRWTKRSAMRVGASLFAATVIAFAVWAWVKVPELYVSTRDEPARLQAIVTTRASVLAALAGLGAIVTIAINYRNSQISAQTAEVAARTLATTNETFRVTERSQLSERFGRAVEHVGQVEYVATRLGGIYALQQIAFDSDEIGDHAAVVEILSALVRLALSGRGCTGMDDTSDGSSSGLSVVPEDVIAAVSVLAGLPSRSESNSFRADLSGIDFTGLSLSGARLVDGNLDGANLRGVALAETDLTRISLNRCNLRGAELSGAVLSGANLRLADLSQSSLVDANLVGVDLSFAQLVDADLRDAIIRDSVAISADFSGAQLRLSNLTAAELTESSFRGAMLDEVEMIRAELRGVEFRNASLRHAKLNLADLSGANFEGADLVGVDLSTCVGLEVDSLSDEQKEQVSRLPDSYGRPTPLW